MKQGGISSASVRSRKWASILLLSLVLPLFLPLGSAALAQQNDANRQAKNEPPPRTLYRIQLELDFDARTYEGRERVRWVNRDDRPASVVYFHLYPNLRAEDERPGNQDASPESAAPEEPRLLVTSVRAGEGGQMLPFAAADADGVTLRGLLGEAVAPGAGGGRRRARAAEDPPPGAPNLRPRGGNAAGRLPPVPRGARRCRLAAQGRAE